MMSTLVLNASYEPLGVVSWKRAVALVLMEKAEVLEEDDEPLRSASYETRMPRVVRLLYMVKVPYRVRVPLSRRALMTRDEHRCAYTDQPRPRRAPQCTGRATTIDHVVPRSRGGRHEWENTVASCSACNAHKDDRLLSELGWGLPFVPRAPRGQAWLVLGLRDAEERWGGYLGSPATATA